MELEKASKCHVFDASGQSVAFGSLFSEQKAIVVFIRHFFCGSCQAYVYQMASKIPKESLEKSDTKLIVIGCGEWQVIQTYMDITGFTNGQIFADPNRQLFRAMGLTTESIAVTPAGQQKKSYLTQSVFVTAITSIWRALHTPTLIGKQGNVKQLGGEFILGPGNVCSFSYAMKHSEDHTELEDLLKEAGISTT